MVSVPVTKAFSYEGRDYMPGDCADLEPVHALAFARIGCVSLTRGYLVKSEAPAEPPRRGRRRKARASELISSASR